MFGLPSIQKLLVLAAVVAIVWYGFKFLGKLQKARAVEAKEHKKATRQTRKGRWRRAKDEALEAEVMVQCPVCEAYVPARGTAACDRPDCPY